MYTWIQFHVIQMQSTHCIVCFLCFTITFKLTSVGIFAPQTKTSCMLFTRNSCYPIHHVRISKPSLFHPLITSASSISCKNVSNSSSSVSSNIVSSNLSTIVCASAFVSVLGLVNQTYSFAYPVQVYTD